RAGPRPPNSAVGPHRVRPARRAGQYVGEVVAPLCTTNAGNHRGGALISCCYGLSELAHAGAERGEDGSGRYASGLGEVIAVGAGDLVDQAMGAQQAEFATGPG